MRAKAIVLGLVVAVGVCAPSPSPSPLPGGGAAVAQELSDLPSDADEDVGPRRRGRLPGDGEDEAETEAGDSSAPAMTAGHGVSRRADPFDDLDSPADAPASRPTAGSGVVVCEAGCDGPRGKVVFGR